MQVIEKPFGDVCTSFRRFGAQIIKQKLAAMAGRQLLEFFTGFGMLFQSGGEFGGHGDVARLGVELERYADHVAGIRTACFTQRGIDLQTVTAGAGGYQCGAGGAVIYRGDYGNVFRLSRFASLRRRCVFAALELLN